MGCKNAHVYYTSRCILVYVRIYSIHHLDVYYYIWCTLCKLSHFSLASKCVLFGRMYNVDLDV